MHCTHCNKDFQWPEARTLFNLPEHLKKIVNNKPLQRLRKQFSVLITDAQRCVVSVEKQRAVPGCVYLDSRHKRQQQRRRQHRLKLKSCNKSSLEKSTTTTSSSLITAKPPTTITPTTPTAITTTTITTPRSSIIRPTSSSVNIPVYMRAIQI